MRHLSPLQAIASLFAVLLLSGCSLFTEPELYLLAPVAGSAAPLASQSEPAPVIALKPVELPKYLKGFRIAVRKSDHQLELAKSQRWAEPLADNFTRVLASNLAQRLGVQQVYLYPRQAPKKIDRIISVVVNEFIGSPQQGVKLEAHWQLFSPSERKIMAQNTLRHQQDLTRTPANTAALVHAMSQNLAALADQIAAQMGR